ncbi:hypothetical protein RQP46_006270 [Phenoliferia psychrophenolica]
MAPREKRSSTKVSKSYNEDDDAHDDEHDEEPVASGSGTRRPAKLKRRAQPDSDDDFGHDSDEDLAPVKKKAKRTAAAPAAAVKGGKGKGRVGKLAKFNEMPLDVLGEICSHLDPLSLLNMSRTTKSIHRLLTSKGSRALWISARRTVALPDLAAEDMTEMAYASLVFERNCMVCGKGRAQKHDYAIRARYCQPCQKKNVVYETKVRGAIPSLHKHALICSPFTLDYVFIPGVQKISERLHALEAEHDQIISSRNGAKASKSKSSKSKGKGKAKAVDQDDDAWKSESSDDTPYTTYLREKQASVAKTREWENTDVRDRQKAALDAAKERTEAIDAKMVALGYDLRDVQSMYSSLYNQGKALTDLIWKKISPQIIAEADRKKAYRLEREAAARRTQRQKLLDPLHASMLDTWTSSDLNFPSLAQFYHLPSIKAFWDPEGVEIEDAAWNAALPTIHSEIREHQATIKKAYFSHLALTLHAAGSPLDPSLVTITLVDPPTYNCTHKATISSTITDAQMDAVFSRFSSRFLCCKSLLSYESMVAHRKTNHRTTGPDVPYYDASDKNGDAPNCLRLLFKRLEKEGRDESTTDEDLEKDGPVYECHGCPSADPKPAHYLGYGYGYNALPQTPIKTTELLWSEALRHQSEVHGRSYYHVGPSLKYSAPIKRMTEDADPELEKEERERVKAAAVAAADDYDSDDFGFGY